MKVETLNGGFSFAARWARDLGIRGFVDTATGSRCVGFRYNLDIELLGTAADAALYTTFVNELSTALHAAGGSLSSDVGSCGPGPSQHTLATAVR